VNIYVFTPDSSISLILLVFAGVLLAVMLRAAGRSRTRQTNYSRRCLRLSRNSNRRCGNTALQAYSYPTPAM